ncbi:hypothetical protein V6N13_130043 [Hibiscus sabdariffa]
MSRSAAAATKLEQAAHTPLERFFKATDEVQKTAKLQPTPNAQPFRMSKSSIHYIDIVDGLSKALLVDCICMEGQKHEIVIVFTGTFDSVGKAELQDADNSRQHFRNPTHL